MKKILLISLLLILSINCYASRDVLVGASNYYPGIYQDENGDVKGFFVDILTEIGKKENWNIEYQYSDWSKNMISIRNGYLDILTGVAYTEKYDKYMDYCEEPILSVWIQVYRSKNVNIRNIFDLENKRVGIIKKDHNVDVFRRYLKELNIKCVLIDFTDYPDIFKNLEKEYLDAAVINNLSGDVLTFKYNVEKTNIILNPFRIYYTAPKGKNSDLLRKIDYYLSNWKKDKNSIYHIKLGEWEHHSLHINEVVPGYVKFEFVLLISFLLLLLIISISLRKIVLFRTKKLEQSQRFLYNTNKMAKVGGWILDKNHNFFWSKELYRIYGISCDTKINLKYLIDKYHKKYETEIYKIVNLYFSDNVNELDIDLKKELTFTLNFTTEKNKLKWLDITLSPVLKNNKVIELMGAAKDITDLKKTEQETIKITERIKQIQKMEALDLFANGITHDFNNILSGIFGYTDLLSEKIKDNNLKEYINGIQNSADKAKKLIEQMLFFSKKEKYEKELIQINLSINETLKMIKVSIPNNIKLLVDIQSVSYIYMSKTNLHRIVMNLITNSIQELKNKKQGCIYIDVKDINVYKSNISYSKLNLIPGQYVQISIGDNGLGIPNNIKDKIFDPYFSTKEEGTGLGLSVVHGIIQNHEGIIKLYTEIEYGCSFMIYLPIYDKYNNRVLELDKKKHKNGKGTILIVDDEEVITNLLFNFLIREGYTVYCCNNSLEAFNIFKENINKFDLVLTDLNMPHMNGLDFINKIKYLNFNIKVILFTGFSALIDKVEFERLKIDKFIEKPFSNKNLLVLIEEVLKNNKI